MKILVISDIHGNAEALRAVLRAESDADATIFLGDALLAGPQANETAQLLHELSPDLAIMGNHDEEIFDHSIFEQWPEEWVELNMWIIDRLDREMIAPIKNYLPAGNYGLGDMKFFLHHGQLQKSSSAALPDAPDETFANIDGDSDCRFVLFGHTHVQFIREIGSKVYINPGSVGQPRCGKLQACYGVFKDGTYEACQVSYDPEPWLKALESMDVLDSRPEFKRWLREALLTGFGIGKREPWSRYAAEGFN